MAFCKFEHFLPCQQNVSKSFGAKALKLGELIDNDEEMTWLTFE